jgi:SulP family sulfate permease
MKQRVQADLVAGVATGAVVLPQAMAYATIAGLPVQFGLYVATVPMLVYALLGTSRPLSVSTTSAVAALTASAISAATDAPSSGEAATAAATLAVIAGAALLVAGALRLGFLAEFISAPVLAGFKVGTGLVIAAGQLDELLGIDVEGEGFFRRIGSALGDLGDVHVRTLALALATVLGLVALRRWAPRVPGALVAIVGGIAAVRLLGLDDDGVAVVPSVPAGLPGPEAPDTDLIEDLVPYGLAVALMTFVESIAAARAFQRAEDPPVHPGRELLALGGASAAGGVFQSLPAAGGLSQTAVNDANGARSPWAGAATALFGFVVLLFLTPLFDGLAYATLGAVVLVAVWGLLDTTTLRRIAAIRRRDLWLALVAVAGILVFGVLAGVLIAVVTSMLVLVYGVNRMPVRSSKPAPGLLVLRPEGMLYFANARRVRDRVLELVDSDKAAPGVVVMDGSAVPDADTTALVALAELDEELRRRGIELWLAGLTQRPREMLLRTDRGRQVRLFGSPGEAVDAFTAR